MQGSGGFPEVARAGLEQLGVEADELELTVMEAVDAIYRPDIDALLDADLDGVEPERRIDPSAPPQ